MAAPTMYIAVALVMTSAPTDFQIETLSSAPFSSPKQCEGFLEGYAMRDVFKKVRKWVTVTSTGPEKEKPVISYESGFGYIIEHKNWTLVYDVDARQLEYVDKNDDGKYKFTKFRCIETEAP
jgi:hypothetical protein